MRIAIVFLFASVSSFLPIQLSAQPFPYQDSTLSVAARVEDLLSRMTMDEKIGQMMQVDLSVVRGNPSILTANYIGSVLSGGGSDPSGGNSALVWANAYDTLQVYALKTPLQIPMIYGIDAVHGHNNVSGATIFPHNIGLGCTRNPGLIKEAARITAAEVAATGIDWTFGPCITVPRDERWGRTYEGFGEAPELARLMGSSAIKGFQGDSLTPASILACAKHFLGDGGTSSGDDQGNVVSDEAGIRAIHLPGYISAVDSNVGSIMASFSSINGVKMHGSKYWITDVLKGELGFKGFVVSDWAAIDQISGDYKVCVDSSISAGIDMVMLPNRYSEFHNDMLGLIGEGKIDTARVDDAVRRILTVKFKLGLFEHPFCDRSLLPQVGSAEHRSVARQCVRESMVLLKKKDGILPLPKTNTRILVAGSNADDLGNQCGGWTISWQGGSGNITTGTTILQGLRNAAPGAQIDYSRTGDFADTAANYSIVIIGETPYAEGNGDSQDLSVSRSDIELIKKMKNYGAPVIVLLVSGRPMIIEKILHYSDVISAAWLPGTEGDGVADVLFGDYQPTGILSCTWPKSMLQIPINIGDANYSPLYAYGYGITTLVDSPPGSAPECLSAIIAGDGRCFELSFNKQMEDPSALTAVFSILRNGFPLSTSTQVSLKSGDSTTLIVELDSVFYLPGDSGLISYSSGTLESFDDGVLQPFGPLQANNLVRRTAVFIPARIEAEYFSDMLGVQIEPTNDIDGVSHLTGLDAGDWMDYSINVPTTGSYYITMRYASESAGYVQFVIKDRAGTYKSLPSTGGLQNWTIAQVHPGFNSGEQPIIIKVITGGFNLNWFSLSTTTEVGGEALVPFEYKLGQNFPNPFNPVTEINYTIGKSGVVNLSLYNVLGQQVKVLVNELLSPGRYSYRLDCSDLSSGIYFYRLEASGFSDVKKMVFVK